MKDRCLQFQVNQAREDFICVLPHGHSSSMAHKHTDGTRWRMPGEKRGKLRPYGIRKTKNEQKRRTR